MRSLTSAPDATPSARPAQAGACVEQAVLDLDRAWHAVTPAEALQAAGSCPDGLSEAEVARRLERRHRRRVVGQDGHGDHACEKHQTGCAHGSPPSSIADAGKF